MMVRISSVMLATAGTLMFSSLSADSMMKLRFLGRSPLNTTEPTCDTGNPHAQLKQPVASAARQCWLEPGMPACQMQVYGVLGRCRRLLTGLLVLAVG